MTGKMKIGLWALFAGLLAVGVVLMLPTIRGWIGTDDADDTPEAEKFLSTDVPDDQSGQANGMPGMNGTDPMSGGNMPGQGQPGVPGQNPQAMQSPGMGPGPMGGQTGADGYPKLPSPMTGGPGMGQGGQMSGPPAGYGGSYYSPGKNSDSDILSQNYQQGSKYAMNQSQPGTGPYGGQTMTPAYGLPKQQKIQGLQTKINKLKYELQGLEMQLQQEYQSSQKPVPPQPYPGNAYGAQGSQAIVCEGDGTTLGGTCQPQGGNTTGGYGQNNQKYMYKQKMQQKNYPKNYAGLKMDIKKLRKRVKQLEKRVALLENSP